MHLISVFHLKKGYAIIENNTINADSYGIQFTSADSKNSIVDNNVVFQVRLCNICLQVLLSIIHL